MEGIDFMPFLVLEGSHGEMGLEYGRKVKSYIEKNLEHYLRRFRDQAGLSMEDISKFGQIYRTSTYQYSQAIADMLEGIAQGAGIQSSHIFALNARTEMLYGLKKGEEGCTSIAALPTITHSSHTLIGQNWDWHPDQCDVMLLLATKDENGFVILTLTEAGMIAKTGLNSKGLGLCANLLVSDRDHRGKGVPYHILLRGVLESNNMADAIRAAVAHPRSASGNFLLADSDGEAVDIEAVPGDFGYLLPMNNLITHSNHFLTRVPVFDEKKAYSALTILRPERARHLLQPQIDEKNISIQNFQEVFRDHYCFPNGICRHIDPRDSEPNRVCSAFSIVMDLNDREYYIAKGTPCENEYIKVSLDSIY